MTRAQFEALQTMIQATPIDALEAGRIIQAVTDQMIDCITNELGTQPVMKFPEPKPFNLQPGQLFPQANTHIHHCTVPNCTMMTMCTHPECATDGFNICIEHKTWACEHFHICMNKECQREFPCIWDRHAHKEQCRAKNRARCRNHANELPKDLQ